MDMKEAAFALIIILVSVSSLAEWAKADALLSKHTTLSSIDDVNSSSIAGDLRGIELSTGNAIESASRANIVGFTTSFLSLFPAILGILYKVFFSWMGLLTVIFTGIGLAGLDVVFIVPIGIIELIAILYLLKDVVGMFWGGT